MVDIQTRDEDRGVQVREREKKVCYTKEREKKRRSTHR